jgi:uncharacterized repeat protein (TIGR01451 family)
MNRYVPLAALIVSLAFANQVLAQEAGSIRVQTVAEQEQTVVLEDGREERRLVPVTKVVPGDEVVYTIVFTNVGEEPADAVRITNPIPREMRYVEGTAFGPGTRVTYSVDGGQTYAEADALTVVADDGAARPARVEDYTHIRWELGAPLDPGAKGFARYRAALN